MTHATGPALLNAHREILAQALADAVYYRDPPLYCGDCHTLATSCPQCTAGISRARAYLALSRQLDIATSPALPAAAA
jgi:hypothetical protein